jgi:hypothetical protein
MFLTLSSSSYSQDSNTQAKGTTEEEYNYLSKGYKVQIESGLDMKKGYVFQDFGEVKQSSYSFNFKLLMRETKREVAGILVITKSEVSGNTYYVAIPIKNSDLMPKYYAVINGWDESLTTVYCYVISSYFANLTAAVGELEKKVKTQ